MHRRLAAFRPSRGLTSWAELIWALALLSGLGAAREAQAAARRTAPSVGGRVIYVAGDAVYLDRGRTHGVAPGVAVPFAKGAGVASCTVEVVSDATAVCTASGAAVGDAFTLPALAPVPAAPAAPAASTPRWSNRQQEKLRAKLAAPTFVKVPFAAVGPAPAATGGFGARGSATIRHGVWAAVGGARALQEERADLRAIADNVLWTGVTLRADMSGALMSQRPARERFRPNDDAQLYVWEAAIELRRNDLPFTFAVGRLRPWLIPGLSQLDGAQVGWRPEVDTELGVFGGLLADRITTMVTADRWTFGAYGSTEGRPAPGVALRGQARASFVRLPGEVMRLGAEVMGLGRFGRWLDATAGVRASTDVSPRAAFEIDGAHVDLGSTPLEGLTLVAAARYLGPDSSFGGFEGMGLAAAGTYSGEGGVRYLVTDWLALALSGGVVAEPDFTRVHGFVGPELLVPRLGRWSAALGSIHELDAFEAHTGYVRLGVEPLDGLRLAGRAAYTFQLAPPGSTFGLHEVGLWGDVRWDATSWLALQLTLNSRIGGGLRFGSGIGLGGQLSLIGSL